MRRLAATACAALILFAFLGVHPALAQSALYRSNSSGVLLERIPAYRRDESPYIMEVTRKPGSEVERLYKDGKETTRWEISLGETGAKKEEREFAGGILSAHRVYGTTGDLLLEETYVDGVLDRKAAYQYTGGRLSVVRVTAADGSLAYTERFFLTTQGGLREVRRENADGSTVSSVYLGGSTGVREERENIAEATYVTRYDGKGHVVSREQRESGKITLLEDYTFRPGTDVLFSSSERHLGDDTLIERRYDEKGHLTTETVTMASKFSEQTDYSWDAGGLNTSKRRRSAAGIEEWRYTYDAAGTLSQEDYFKRGAHEKTVVYTAKDERYEEYFKAGELFLKAYYTGEKKTKEEVYSAGRMVRERSFE